MRTANPAGTSRSVAIETQIPFVSLQPTHLVPDTAVCGPGRGWGESATNRRIIVMLVLVIVAQLLLPHLAATCAS
jgi:hypothetical protein